MILEKLILELSSLARSAGEISDYTNGLLLDIVIAYLQSVHIISLLQLYLKSFLVLKVGNCSWKSAKTENSLRFS